MKINQNRKKILIIADHFIPGIKAGGPIRSITNLVEILTAHFDIDVITKNHDIQEANKPFENIEPNKWTYNKKLKINIYYFSSRRIAIFNFIKIMRKNKYDFIYLNSFFSPKATILPLFASIFSTKAKIILAPRGELSPSALEFKSFKKNIYILLFKNLLEKVIYKYHFTSLEENINFEKIIGVKEYHIVQNLTSKVKIPFAHLEKAINYKADFIAVSRISPIKNLLFLIDTLSHCKENITLDIYGYIEDQNYWTTIQESIKLLPNNVSVKYRGVLNPQIIHETIQKYRFFISTSKSENFGHSIFEAFASGRPVVIGTMTPWNNLESNSIGWNIDVNDKISWARQIDDCINMPIKMHYEYCFNAYKFAHKFNDNINNTSEYLKLFN